MTKVAVRSCEEHFTCIELEEVLTRMHGGSEARARYLPQLLDLGEGRLRGMDEAGIDMQILSLVTPGVQDLAPEAALALARDCNDRLADAVARYPDRFAGLAAAPPQAARRAAVELERAVSRKGLRGLVIHSHTDGEYLDDQKFWPLLEAAEALDVPVYLHPRSPSENMAGPALDIPGFRVGWSFAIETGTHALRMIASGLFDRFPRLQVMLGHMGELLPFAIPRIDTRYVAEGMQKRPGAPSLTPGEYLQRNFLVTTSGLNSWPQLEMTLKVMGEERVLFAVDYPFEAQQPAVEALRSFPLPEAQRRMLCDTNALRVFGLSLPARRSNA